MTRDELAKKLRELADIVDDSSMPLEQLDQQLLTVNQEIKLMHLCLKDALFAVRYGRLTEEL